MPELQTLMTGLAFGESARWHDDCFWFADWGTQEVIAVDLDGKSEVIVRVPTARPETRLNFGGAGQGPFSIDWLPDGRLLIVSGRDRLLLRREPDGSLATHADVTKLSDRPWNEIVVDGRGNAYINGSGCDFVAGEKFAPGIVALVTPDGSARQVADGIAMPNGMAVTPDNSTLIVAESYGKRLTAFDIAADGGLSNRRLWADLGEGVPDGICIDADNAVWYADVPNKRCVRVREGGEVLQSVDLDRGCFACALGGVDKRTLFMVATEWRGPAKAAELAGTGQILMVEAPVPGVGSGCRKRACPPSILNYNCKRESIMATVLEEAEQKVILSGVGWETYERLLVENEDSAGTRFNYDQGTLEIMVLSAEHERLKQTLTTLVELVAAALGIDVDGVGLTTFRKKGAGKGLEADASFYIKNADRVAGKARIDLAVDPPPDLAIEIDITSPSLNKLPIYASLLVPEVWRYDGYRITILVLRGGAYVECEASEALTGLTAEVLSHTIEASKVMRRSDWVRFVGESAKG